MTRPRPIVPRPDRPAPTQPRPGTPSPIHPDGPTRPPTRYVDSIATVWRWTQIGIYLAITTIQWAAERIHRPATAKFRALSWIGLAMLLSLGLGMAMAYPHPDYTPADVQITWQRATPEEALIHQLDQAAELDELSRH